MANIVIEDGSKVAGANSYLTEAELDAYAADRGITITGTNDQLLILAMDYIEQQNFQGIKTYFDQAVQWPRTSVYIDSYPIDFDEIPVLLKEAQAEFAIGVDGGNNPLNNEERQTKKEKVDVISVEYTDGSRNQTYLKAAHSKLQKLLKNGSTGVNAVAYRS